MKLRHFVAVLAAAALSIAALAADANSAKILIQGKAKGDGQIKVAVIPTGGEKKEVSVTVAKKMPNEDIARDLAKELKVALGEAYDVDHYDPDKIKISAKDGKATFKIELGGSTVKGVSIEIK